MNKEEVLAVLKQNKITIVEEKRTNNDLGTILKLYNGCLVNCWDSGKVNCQGKNTEEIEGILKASKVPQKPINNKVFVVYGHDTVARTQLEPMLRRWDLEPLILEQLVSAGQTIFVPSMKMVSPEISPVSKSALDISARIRLEQGAKWMLRNRANVAWSGAGASFKRN